MQSATKAQQICLPSNDLNTYTIILSKNSCNSSCENSSSSAICLNLSRNLYKLSVFSVSVPGSLVSLFLSSYFLFSLLSICPDTIFLFMTQSFITSIQSGRSSSCNQLLGLKKAGTQMCTDLPTKEQTYPTASGFTFM